MHEVLLGRRASIVLSMILALSSRLYDICLLAVKDGERSLLRSRKRADDGEKKNIMMHGNVGHELGRADHSGLGKIESSDTGFQVFQ